MIGYCKLLKTKILLEADCYYCDNKIVVSGLCIYWKDEIGKKKKKKESKLRDK